MSNNIFAVLREQLSACLISFCLFEWSTYDGRDKFSLEMLE